MPHYVRIALASLALLFVPMAVAARAATAPFTMAQVLGYPFVEQVVASRDGRTLAWIDMVRGVRNIWIARAPDYVPRALTTYATDDGQELSNLALTRDGSEAVYVRGGDHDANWPEALQPDPLALPVQPHMQVWEVATAGGAPRVLGNGDTPAIAPDGSRVAFIHDPEMSVWVAPMDASSAAKPLLFDRGKASDLRWSPNGNALAFVSTRGDHGFIAVYRNDTTPTEYLAPSTQTDVSPRWSPDGSRIAFIRLPGQGGAPPANPLAWAPLPWSIMVADVRTGTARVAWRSPDTLRGSYPQLGGDPGLHWAANDGLVFIAEMDNWEHLYRVSANGGTARLLTPGAFMIEQFTVSADGTRAIYCANAGTTAGDSDRRHLFDLDLNSGSRRELTAGASSEWDPTFLDNGVLAFVRATAQQPPLVTLGTLSGTTYRALGSVPADFPTAALVTPKSVAFRAKDGTLIHGQLFAAPGNAAKKPGIVFVHGGPPRQMLLTWHNMDYYSNSYAVNQYLAAHGFVVLSVNYRLGIGYGHDFHYPAHWGPTGAAEYQDVVAGARYLQHDPGVQASRIGIWGGSYGGYLTALALARNSDIFKAGVDMHGVHDWSMELADWIGKPTPRYQTYNVKAVEKLAWDSSPDASIATWRSPVLLIQGDDDRNVSFSQTVDLVERLKKTRVQYQVMVLPDEIHGFLRYASWLKADAATAAFFERKLQQPRGAAP